MEQFFILVLVGLTSAGAYVLGLSVLGLSTRGIRDAVGKMLECFGISLVFFVINLATGVIAILLARAAMRGFVSLYMVTDVTLPVLSLMQGLTFQWWRDLSGS